MSIQQMFLGAGGGGVGNILSIDSQTAGTSVIHNGLEFFYSNNTDATTSENKIVFTANPGAFYVAMIGAAGGTGGSLTTKAIGANGGIGIAKITVSTQTQYTLVIGGGGIYHETTSAQRSCVGGGLANAAGSSTYQCSTGGGGLVALLNGTPTAPTCSGSSSSTYSQSDVIVCVGSGGGGGMNSGSTRYTWLGHGGGFDQVGLPTTAAGTAYPTGGTLTAGGAKGTYTTYGSNNTDGSACLGGAGCTNTSVYDNGAGGGAGWYGGGGGSAGGGFTGGPGGGGSGKINSTTAAIANDGSGNDYTDDGSVNTYDPNSQLQTWIQTVSGESFVIPSSSYGIGNTDPDNTRSGWVCIWTAPE